MHPMPRHRAEGRLLRRSMKAEDIIFVLAERGGGERHGEPPCRMKARAIRPQVFRAKRWASSKKMIGGPRRAIANDQPISRRDDVASAPAAPGCESSRATRRCRDSLGEIPQAVIARRRGPSGATVAVIPSSADLRGIAQPDRVTDGSPRLGRPDDCAIATSASFGRRHICHSGSTCTPKTCARTPCNPGDKLFIHPQMARTDDDHPVLFSNANRSRFKQVSVIMTHLS